MSKITRFEDLETWQLSRGFTKDVYLLMNELDVKKEYELKNQLKKASLSIMNNIAEGFGRYNRKDFIRFLDYSSGSSSEVKSMFYLMEDLEMVKESQAIEIRDRVDVIQSKVLGLIRHLIKESR
ncbi:MAG: four helix bundle protein [Bacteroidales bacterium]|nr:four helix bundle protein [Bacteroidales bacterium]